jgi:ribosomal protein S18 acetylase RimI-like enzyme
MSEAVGFRPAADFTLAGLADLYTRCFAGYTYPLRIEPATLARRIATEQIDLHRSPVLEVAGVPAGVALLGVRGSETNCGGFGIIPDYRGRGLAHVLLAEHLRLARAAGGRRMSLMVIAENRGALTTYLRAGMQIRRRLLWLEWQASAVERSPGSDRVVAVRPEQLLAQFADFPRATPFWQRDPATLKRMDWLEGWALPSAAEPDAYALVELAPGGFSAILDLAARAVAPAHELIAALQAQYTALSINEPEASPMLPPLRAAGFRVGLTRYELDLAL